MRAKRHRIPPPPPSSLLQSQTVPLLQKSATHDGTTPIADTRAARVERQQHEYENLQKHAVLLANVIGKAKQNKKARALE